MDVEPSRDLRNGHGGVPSSQSSDSGGGGGTSALHPDSKVSRTVWSIGGIGAVLMGLLQAGLAVALGVGGNWGEVATRVAISVVFVFLGVQMWRRKGGGRARTYRSRKSGEHL